MSLRDNMSSDVLDVTHSFSSDLVDVESDVQEVDLVVLPAVSLQQLHQHRAVLLLLLLRLGFVLLFQNLLALVDLILLAVIVVLLFLVLVFLVLLSEHQLELGVLPEGLWCELKEKSSRAAVGVNG